MGLGHGVKMALLKRGWINFEFEFEIEFEFEFEFEFELSRSRYTDYRGRYN